MSRIYSFWHFLLAGFFRVLYRVKVVGIENIPKEGGAVLCSNHIAIRDVFIIGCAINRQPRFIAKKELFNVPVLRKLIKSLGAISIDRHGTNYTAIKTAINLAKDGELVTIFPQGTRRPGVNPYKTEIKNGAGMIAVNANVPTIPLCIATNKYKYRLFRKVTVYIGAPIYNTFEAETNNDLYEKYTAKTFHEICQLGGYVQDEV